MQILFRSLQIRRARSRIILWLLNPPLGWNTNHFRDFTSAGLSSSNLLPWCVLGAPANLSARNSEEDFASCWWWCLKSWLGYSLGIFTCFSARWYFAGFEECCLCCSWTSVFGCWLLSKYLGWACCKRSVLSAWGNQLAAGFSAEPPVDESSWGREWIVAKYSIRVSATSNARPTTTSICAQRFHRRAADKLGVCGFIGFILTHVQQRCLAASTAAQWFKFECAFVLPQSPSRSRSQVSLEIVFNSSISFKLKERKTNKGPFSPMPTLPFTLMVPTAFSFSFKLPFGYELGRRRCPLFFSNFFHQVFLAVLPCQAACSFLL